MRVMRSGRITAVEAYETAETGDLVRLHRDDGRQIEGRVDGMYYAGTEVYFVLGQNRFRMHLDEQVEIIERGPRSRGY